MEVQIIKKVDKSEIERKTYSNKLKVAAYARVSTDLDDQKNSFQSQQKYYLKKISSNSKWNCVGMYADEGISGTQIFKRDKFQEMIDDALDGKIDLILTKSISRFARNTVDTLNYVRMLKNKNVGVFFEEENINTLDMAGELLLTVLSSVAQQESETISSHIKLGLKMKRERGEIVAFSSCYGYRYNKNKDEIVIVEKEAKIVRSIFNMYCSGQGSTSICRTLNETKVPTRHGGKWIETTIISILKNEKYVGDLVQGKTYTIDPISHKRKCNTGEQDKYIIRNHHEPIINRDTFEKVQDLFNNKNSNKSTGNQPQSRYLFSGKCRCGFCGKAYTKKSTYKLRPAWDCLTVAKGARNLCQNSKVFYEDVLKSCFMEAFNILTKDKFVNLDRFMKILKASSDSSLPERNKCKLETERRKLKTQNSNLVSLFLEGSIDSVDFEKKNLELKAKIDKYEKKIKEINELYTNEDKIKLRFENIKNVLKEKMSENTTNEFDEDLFEGLVDYVIIGGIDENDDINSFVIRFICKKDFSYKSRTDITDEVIIRNNRIGMEGSIYLKVLDFVSEQNFTIFLNKENVRRKTTINKVRIIVEVEKDNK